MSSLDPRAIASLVKDTVQVAFDDQLVKEADDISKVGIRDSDPGDTVKYRFRGWVPQMEEWLGARTLSALRSFEVDLKKRRFQSTPAISTRVRTLDALLGDAAGVGRDLVTELRVHQDLLFFEMFEDNPTCYDGKALFATDHESGESGAQSNIVAGTGVDTVAKVKADPVNAITRGQGYKNDRGRNMGLFSRGSLFVVMGTDPNLYLNMREALNATMIAQTTNVLAGIAQIIERPELVDANDWYLVDASRRRARLGALVEEGTPTLAFLEGSDHEFLFSEILIGIEQYYAAVPLLWQCAVKVTNT